MATGDYATTLISRPSDSPLLELLLRAPSSSGSSSSPSLYSASGPLRKRRRTNNHKLEKEEEKEISQGGSYQLLEKAITQLARSRRNVLQQAIDLLEEEYSKRLSSEHMDVALDCLENEAKSSMFTSIKYVSSRDRWLARHAGVVILDE
ncbi:hypothetical protein V1527DRAFT_312707 [Lipomyces starkeyi]